MPSKIVAELCLERGSRCMRRTHLCLGCNSSRKVNGESFVKTMLDGHSILQSNVCIPTTGRSNKLSGSCHGLCCKKHGEARKAVTRRGLTPPKSGCWCKNLTHSYPPQNLTTKHLSSFLLPPPPSSFHLITRFQSPLPLIPNLPPFPSIPFT